MILEALRKNTRPFHEAIETNRLLASLLEPSLTREGYVAVLRKFYGFLAPLEKSMAQECDLAEFGAVIKRRLKTPLLEMDLACFKPETTGDPILFCDDLPSARSLSQQLGIFYVCEGATLGGRMISKAIQGSIGITPDSGGAYFNGYGQDTLLMWSESGKIIEEFTQKKGVDPSEITLAAAETFSKLHQWLDVEEGAYEF